MLKSGMKNEAVVKAAEELCEKDLIRLSKLRKKGLPEELIDSILKNSKNFGNYSDEAFLLIKSSTKSFDDVLKLIDDYGDDFINAYKKHGDDAVDACTKYGKDGGTYLDAIAEAIETGIYKEVEIIDSFGSPLGELDEIALKDLRFFEDKSAQGLNTLNPATGLPYQTAQQWAEKQILNKTITRIENLKVATATRVTVNGTQIVPTIDEIRNINKFTFRMDADTAELRQAVEAVLDQLRTKYPGYTFDATYGGGL